MDYMEGLLLGRFFTDTDYENKKHPGLFIFYGLLVSLALGLSLFSQSVSGLVEGSSVIKGVLFMVLFLATPFMAFRYYRYPMAVRFLLLLLQGLKYFLLTLLFINLLLPRFQFSESELRTNLISFLNQTLESFTAQFSGSAGNLSMIFGVLVGGLYLLFLAVLILAAAVILPGLVFIMVKYIQRAYDLLVVRLYLRKYMDL